MKRTRRFLSLTSMIFALILFSCAKDGEDGAIGPSGPQGEQGLPGTDGMDGANGEDSGANDVESTADVFSPVLNEVVGSSTLLRGKNGLSAEFETSGLTPGYAYTLWWGVFNQPENCNDTPCSLDDLANPEIKADFLFVSGLVADDSGTAIFSGALLENDGSTSVNDQLLLPIDVGGLWDAQKAQIQLLLRSHGPAVTGMVDDQISTYGGGCTDFLFPFSEIPDEEGECAEMQVSVHLVVSN